MVLACASGAAVVHAAFTTFESGQVRPLALSPDGRSLAHYHDNGSVLRVAPLDGSKGWTEYQAPLGTFKQFSSNIRSALAFAWASDSQSVWTGTHERLRPSGFATSPLRAVRTMADGALQTFPDLQHSAGPLDALLWKRARIAEDVGGILLQRMRELVVVALALQVKNRPDAQQEVGARLEFAPSGMRVLVDTVAEMDVKAFDPGHAGRGPDALAGSDPPDLPIGAEVLVAGIGIAERRGLHVDVGRIQRLSVCPRLGDDRRIGGVIHRNRKDETTRARGREGRQKRKQDGARHRARTGAAHSIQVRDPHGADPTAGLVVPVGSSHGTLDSPNRDSRGCLEHAGSARCCRSAPSQLRMETLPRMSFAPCSSFATWKLAFVGPVHAPCEVWRRHPLQCASFLRRQAESWSS
jgi:hypothetical protein